MENYVRFEEKKDWKTWFKVFLGLIIGYQAISCLIALGYLFQIQLTGPTEWLAVFISFLHPIAINTGAILTLLKVKWGFYFLIGVESLGVLSAIVSIFMAGMGIVSAFGALITGALIPGLLVFFVYSGVASNTGTNLFQTTY